MKTARSQFLMVQDLGSNWIGKNSRSTPSCIANWVATRTTRIRCVRDGRPSCRTTDGPIRTTIAFRSFDNSRVDLLVRPFEGNGFTSKRARSKTLGGRPSPLVLSASWPTDAGEARYSSRFEGKCRPGGRHYGAAYVFI